LSCGNGHDLRRAGGRLIPACSVFASESDLSSDDEDVYGASSVGPAFYPDIRRGRPIYLSGVWCREFGELERAGYDVGVLLQPESHLEGRVADHRVWAADNGCFAKGSSFDANAWFSWVSELPRITAAHFGCSGSDYESRLMNVGVGELEPYGCLFVVAPDVVGDAERTWERSAPWFERIRSLGFPVALVAQDGAEAHAPMWDEVDAWDCLFIGGSTDWKLSSAARDCVREAHLSAKWCHMGRVNSLRRLRIAAAWNVDSVDGTFLRCAPRANVPRMKRWLDCIEADAAVPRLFAP